MYTSHIYIYIYIYMHILYSQTWVSWPQIAWLDYSLGISGRWPPWLGISGARRRWRLDFVWSTRSEPHGKSLLGALDKTIPFWFASNPKMAGSLF